MSGYPAHKDSAHTDSAHTDSAHTDSAHTDPAHTDPAHTDPVELFRSAGEFGVRFAELNWPAGPLGPIGQWPVSLRTAALMIVHSPAPMLLRWGPAGVTIFNQAVAELLGPSSMVLLGRPADDEHWLSADRRSTVERRTTWTSPVWSESGQPAGTLTILSDSESLRQAAALAGLAAAMSTVDDIAALAAAMAQHLPAVFAAHATRVGWLEPGNPMLEVVISVAGPGGSFPSRSASLPVAEGNPLGRAVLTLERFVHNQPLRAPAADPQTAWDDVAGSVALPLCSGDGTALGAIEIGWRHRVEERESLGNLIDTVAALCSQAMHRADLGRATNAIAALAASLSVTRSTKEAIEAILAHAPRALGATMPGLAIREHGKKLTMWYRELPEDLAASYANLDLDDPRALVEAVRDGSLIIVPDRAAFAARYPGLVDHAGLHGLTTTVALPLFDSERRPVAALGMGWSRTRPFRQTDLALLDTIADLAEQTLERTRLVAAEHDLVSRLAARLVGVPATAHPQVEIATRYQPAMSGLNLGGDWCDVITLPEQRIAVVLGDVVGHHVEAAADMAQLKTIINTLIRLGTPLAEVFGQLSELTDQGFLGTAVAMIIDSPSGRVDVVRAGHPFPLLLRRGNGPVPLGDDDSLPLGLVTGAMPVTTVSLSSADVILAYTDGLVERRGHSYDDGVKALHRVVGELGERPVDAIADEILREMPPSDDDRALVVLRWRAPGEFMISSN